LLKLGIVPMKSLVIQFPKMPDSHVIHFFRGVFDGDGSLSSKRFRLYSGSKIFINEAVKKLAKCLNVDKADIKTYEELYRKEPFYVLAIYKKNIMVELHRQFYAGVSKNEYLERKKHQFDKLIGK